MAPDGHAQRPDRRRLTHKSGIKGVLGRRGPRSFGEAGSKAPSHCKLASPWADDDQPFICLFVCFVIHSFIHSFIKHLDLNVFRRNRRSPQPIQLATEFLLPLDFNNLHYRLAP